MASHNSFAFSCLVIFEENVKPQSISHSLAHFHSQSLFEEGAMRSNGEGQLLPAGSSAQARRGSAGNGF